MTNKELIKQEIERMYKETKSVDCFTNSVIKTTLERLRDFINLLPEEYNKDLEEAASKYVREDFHERSRADFKAGAEWQKKQMIKNAVECVSCTYSNQEGTFLHINQSIGTKDGDKVKIIIVK